MNPGGTGRNPGGECRKMRKDCSNCRLKCPENLSEADRQKIFDTYWAMNDKIRRRDFIAANVTRFQKKTLTG